jgi:hypothetical protein
VSLLRFILALAAALFLTSCGKKEASMTTGEVIASGSLAGLKGDTAYAKVQSSALPVIYENFKAVLNQRGLVKWDSRYDCNHFAALYIAIAQTDYAVAAWHSSTTAQTLALAELWYVPGGIGNKGHAIVQAETERGTLYIEPQNGQLLTLTAAELRTVYLRKW